MKRHLKKNNKTANTPKVEDNTQTNKSSEVVNENVECNIGIDISKDIVHICSLPNGTYVKVPNTTEDIVAFFSQNFNGKIVAQVVMEATGGYEKNASDGLAKMGFQVTVLNPKRAHHLMVAFGKNPKTDKRDAQMLAIIAQQFSRNEELLPKYKLPTENQKKLKFLMDRYKQLTEDSIREQNRIDKAKFVNNPTLKEMEESLESLEKLKAKYETLIRELIASDQELKELDEILQSVPGVGWGTSAMLLAYMPELGNCNREEIASLAGLAPHPNDSGQKTGKRSTKCGRTYVKGYWFTAMLNVVRFNSKIRVFYNRLVDNGKAKRLALIASMRKLLTILNQMVRNKQKWNEHLQPKKADSNANQTLPTTTEQTAIVVETTTEKQSTTTKKATTVKSVACKRKATKKTIKPQKSTR